MERFRPLSKRDRLAKLRSLVTVIFLVLAVRLGYLQIVRGEAYARLATEQRERTSTLVPIRGSVALREVDGDEVLIAATRFVPTAYVVPREIRDLDRVAESLAEIVQRYQGRSSARRRDLLRATGQVSAKEAEAEGAPAGATAPREAQAAAGKRREELVEEFRRRLADRRDPYETILPGGERLDAEAIAELQAADLPGIAFREVPTRAYPEGSLAAHLLGFVRAEGLSARGEYGLEAGLDSLLRGEVGITVGERDVVGRLISVGETALLPPSPGADVILTIDRIIQTRAEEIARKGRERFGAERAQVIVMDPHTGALLALAAFPTFDPNLPGAVRDVATFRNPAVSDLFEPGSVFKPLVMAAALEEGLVTPETTMVDGGPIRVGPYKIDTYDGRHHGTVTMTEILEQSNNIGMVWVAQQVGAERLYQFLRRVGVGDRTGLPLPGEAADLPTPPEEWGVTRLATVGFGQGIVTTPLAILVSNAALINGGKLLEPVLVQEMRAGSRRIATPFPKVVRQVLRPEISTTVRAMLASVVEKGVAQRAKVPGYYVGGKTGTAQVVDPRTGRYAPDQKIISFIGFAPADDPKFIALVKLDNPAGLSLASGTAAPLFAELAEKILKYWKIPPSRPDVSDILRGR